jgi:hypothetical protein
LKVAREKHQATYKDKLTRLTADFSTESLKARKVWNDVLQALKGNNFQPKLLNPAKISFISEGEIKTFHNK